MDLNLTGKVAGVTGASEGIGPAVAREPATRSANVSGSAWMIDGGLLNTT